MTWRAMCPAVIAGTTDVSHNVAPLGGGVYLLGEKAVLKTNDAAVVANNFASIDPDISTRQGRNLVIENKHSTDGESPPPPPHGGY